MQGILKSLPGAIQHQPNTVLGSSRLMAAKDARVHRGNSAK
jgi:hypothetical protein